MPKRIELSLKEKNEIIKLYVINNLSLRKIGKLIGNKSQTFIERILKEEGVYINTNGASSLKTEKIEQDKDNDFIYVAICKNTGKEFKDYKNSSGILTTYLKDNFSEIIHPTNYQKRNYKSTTGHYWHEKYFDIIEKNYIKKREKKSSYCNWVTVDVENKSGMYLTHINKEHNISIEEHLKYFPEDKNYFKVSIKKIKKEKILNSFKENYVICKICGKKLKYLTNSHLKTHNITTTDYKLKFPTESIISNKYKKHLQHKYEKDLKFCSNNFSSSAQLKIQKFLEDNNVICEKNNKKLLNGIEIDILADNYKIGIEYNGNFYHTENGGKKNRLYHLNKTLLMNEKEYFLIHIFEDEWEDKKELIKNKLLHIFDKAIYNQKIYARNCIIQEINFDEKNIFLNQYHIQGEDRSNVHLGAFYNNELISIMTFDNKRKMNGGTNLNEYELKRFCSTNKYLIIGIAGKLLSYFIKNYNPKKIISFADRRWTLDANNNLYTKLNFKLTKILSPDYSYYNPKIHRLKRFHKFSFGKSSLKKKYPEIYNDNKTEWEMMQELGYDRIWDCGKFRYELNF
jgi:hypothetical protein